MCISTISSGILLFGRCKPKRGLLRLGKAVFECNKGLFVMVLGVV